VGEVAKVVIDTNILVSGFGWGGKPEELLALVENKQIINFASSEPAIHGEAKDVE